MSNYPEAKVARVSGIRKGLLADTRRTACKKGVDWTLDERNQVTYTAAGLEKICAALRLDQAGLQEGVAAGFRPEPAGAAGAAAGPSACLAEASAPGPEVAAILQGGDHDQPPDLSGTSGPAAPLISEKISAGPVAMHAADVLTRAVRAVRAVEASVVEVTVTGVPVRGNKLLLFGTIEDPKAPSGRQRVTVRVRDNAFFLPGFVIRATPATANYYNFVGRLPRWRGDRFGFTAKPKEAGNGA